MSNTLVTALSVSTLAALSLVAMPSSAQSQVVIIVGNGSGQPYLPPPFPVPLPYPQPFVHTQVLYGGGGYPGNPGYPGGGGRDLQIVRAYYGLNNRTNDVTQLLRGRVQNSSLVIQVNNNNMGGDPAVGGDKVLTVIYRYQGREQTSTVKEGNTLRIP